MSSRIFQSVIVQMKEATDRHDRRDRRRQQRHFL